MLSVFETSYHSTGVYLVEINVQKEILSTQSDLHEVEQAAFVDMFNMLKHVL